VGKEEKVPFLPLGGGGVSNGRPRADSDKKGAISSAGLPHEEGCSPLTREKGERTLLRPAEKKERKGPKRISKTQRKRRKHVSEAAHS